MSIEYIDPETGLAFLSTDGQMPAGARRVEGFANAEPYSTSLLDEGCAEEVPRQPAAAAGPANAGAAYGPAGPATDAEEVYRSYQALPLSERLRFWLFLNDAEQDFTLETLRELKRRLDKARVDITDRPEYERAYEPMRAALGLLGANAQSGGPEERDVDSGPASSPPQAIERNPAGRGKILGARARR